MTLPTDLETRRRKLLFRAQRRGFRELDLIFAAFTDAHLAGLGAEELDQLEALLDVPDWELYGWIAGLQTVPPSFNTSVYTRLAAYRENIGQSWTA